MKSRYLLLAFLTGAFLLILFGVSILQAPEVIAVSYEAPDSSTINGTTIYTTYLPIIFRSAVLYSDDFSNPASGWPTGDSNRISLSYQGGEYEIKIRKSNWWAGAVPPIGDISNYSVESEARLYTGSVGVYGLIFDRQDWDRFNIFVVIPSSQIYTVLQHKPNDNWSELVSFTSSAAINTGSAVNKLKLEREGDKASIYVNDQFLTTFSDSTYSGTSSEVGLFAQTFAQQPIAARFDYFLVKQLPGFTTTALSQNAALSTELTGQGAGGIRLDR